MKVNILSRKLIKPSSPTPPNLKNYNLSCSDKLMPLMDVPIILFYSSPPGDTKKSHLEESLAKILPEFYPFVGQYIAKDQLIDCSDQGVEFTEAQVADNHLNLLEFIKEIKFEQLSNLIPQKPTSLLCIQVTAFKCGGVVIGVRIPHILVDAFSLETFIATWADANNNKKKTINPVFYSPPLFPCKNLNISLDIEESRTTTDIVSKMFVFNKEAIASLKAKIRNRASRVRVVCAFIAKALIRLDRAKRGQSPRDCLIGQAVNIRERTNPPLAKHSCGNFCTGAISRGSDNMSFAELVEVLGEATGKTIADCANTLSTSESSPPVLVDPMVNMLNAIAGTETNVLAFSDWTKFRFYDVDFGWGKPVLTSIANIPLKNLTILMGNKEGDGVEAWVHLNPEDMAYFEQDEEIRSFTA